MSKHRRVRSIVRDFDGSSIASTGEGGTSTSSIAATASNGAAHSPSTSPTNTLGPSLSTSRPALGTRASSSSIASLAASYESQTDSRQNTSNSTPTTPDYGYTNTTRRSASGYGSGPARELSYRSQDTHHHQHGGVEPLSTPQLEQLEAEDEFLPLNSPFTPGYSMNGSTPPLASSSTYRRDSSGHISPEAPTSLSAAERREHSRRHSRVHSRNLSVFFPRPEQAGLPGYASHISEEGDNTATQIDIPTAQTRGWGFANGGQSSKPAPFGTLHQPEAGTGSQNGTQPNSRRGHHHRHSMSHNFFPFLDGSSPRRTSGQSNLSPQHARHAQALSPSTSESVPPSASLKTPKSVPALSSSTTSRHRHTLSDPTLIPSISSLNTKYAHLPLPIRLLFAVLFYLPFFTQLVLAVAMLEIGLGARLWIAGQSGESLAVTGLGYLVVFDGLAAMSSIIVEGNARGIEKLWSVLTGRRAGDNNVRFPFGTSRVITLAHFAQCVYLIFSAVYVCKESIEHVLLLHGPDEMGNADGSGAVREAAAHGSAHGSMGHGEMIGSSSGNHESLSWEDVGVTIPAHLLVLSFSACFIMAVTAKNHASLTEAVGPSTYSLRPRRAGPASKTSMLTSMHNAILSNPFTLTTLIFSSTLAVASLLIPAQQLAPLDKVVALLESIAMFYIAYPAAVVTGKVLLQTAPPGFETMEGGLGRLKHVIEEIENHHSVVFLPSPHIWQLNPDPPPLPPLLSKPSVFGRKSLPAPPLVSKEPVVTIITLNVQVRKECTDEEILKLTSWARERCLSAITPGSGYSDDGAISLKTSEGPGASRRTSAHPTQHRQVELTIQVMRFEEARALQPEVLHQNSHSHSHDHGHGHSHDTGHGHAHDQTSTAAVVNMHSHSYSDKSHEAAPSLHSHDTNHGHSHSGHNHGHHH